MAEEPMIVEEEEYVEEEFPAQPQAVTMRTAQMMQQMFAENSGLRGTVLWDLFTSEDIEALKSKLEILFPNNDVEIADEQQILNDESISRDKRRDKLKTLWKDSEKYNQKMKEKRVLLMDNIWTQRKYSNGDLLTTTIFVICTPNITDDTVQLTRSQYSTEFSCHTVIRTRKCFVDDESENCCMIFVDENGRVYQNWADYIENNTLPEGVLVVPKNGIYDFTAENEVILDFFRSPACSAVRRALEITDTTTGVVGMAVAAVPLTALFLPVAAPLLIGAGIVGGVVSLWSIGRSTASLVDRGQHEESINVTDRQARTSWIGIGGGVLGLGASGATHGLARYAASGKEVSSLVQGAVNGINIASMAVNGVGVTNGIVELILKARDDEDVNALDVLQLGASLIIFTHSIYNFRYASQIVEKTHDGKINDFRKELSNRQRKMFNKMYKETIRIKGSKAGKVDVVRSIAKIPDKQYFNDIYKINRALNDQNVRPSFSGDANVLLNNDVNVDSSSLRQSVQHNRGENYLQNLRDIPHSYTGNENSFQLPQLPFNENVAFRITTFVGYTLRNFFVGNESNLRNCFAHLYERLQEDAVEYLLEIARQFVETSLNDIESRLHRVIPFEQVLWDLFEISARLNGVRTSISINFLKDHIQLILEELKHFYEQNIHEPVGELIKCKSCSGSYRISPIS